MEISKEDYKWFMEYVVFLSKEEATKYTKGLNCAYSIKEVGLIA